MLKYLMHTEVNKHACNSPPDLTDVNILTFSNLFSEREYFRVGTPFPIPFPFLRHI